MLTTFTFLMDYGETEITVVVHLQRKNRQ